MSRVLIEILNMSISGSIMILAVLLMRLLLKKAPLWISVLLFGLVGVRLILPVSIEAPFSLIPSGQTIHVTSDTGKNGTSSVDQTNLTIDSGIKAVDEYLNQRLTAETEENRELSAFPTASELRIETQRPTDLLLSVCSIIWLSGLAGILLYSLIRYLRLRYSVAEAVLYRENIYLCDQVQTPFILGIVKPRIYLPSGLEETDFTHVLAHERAHLQRKDPLWKALGFLFLAVYWFNPLMWLSYILFSRDIEAACDEKVIAGLQTPERKAYANALVSCSMNRQQVLVYPLAFGEIAVKTRVKKVLNYKKPAILGIVAAVIACVVLGGCFLTNPMKGANPEGYDFETDLQYYQLREAIKVTRVQNCDGGCYLYHNGFVYKADVKSGEITPLCDKANCLHDQETNPEKRSQCNACVVDGDAPGVSLMLQKDKLYVCVGPHGGITVGGEKNPFSTVMQIAQNGHSKEMLYENMDGEMSLVMAHRGYIYYFVQAFSAGDQGITTKLSVQRLSISRKNNEPETVFSVPDGYHDLGYGFLQAYGKYVYFDLDYTDDSGAHSSLFIYDTESGEITEHEGLGHPSFYNGKLYFKDYNSNEGDDFPTEVYRTDLQGENRETVFEDIPQGYYVVGDEQYLYLNNAILVTWGDLTEKQYWVYDKDLKPVDQFTVPDTDTSYLDPPIGGTDYQYEIFDDPDTGEWGVLVWDKSKIGSYHGAAYEQERIVYGVK